MRLVMAGAGVKAVPASLGSWKGSFVFLLLRGHCCGDAGGSSYLLGMLVTGALLCGYSVGHLLTLCIVHMFSQLAVKGSEYAEDASALAGLHGLLLIPVRRV